MLLVWWVWSHCHELSTQDTSFRNSSNSSPTQILHKPPCQIMFKAPPWKTGISEVIPDHNLIFTDITAWVVTIHTEAAQGYGIGIITAIRGAAHNTYNPYIEVTAIDPAATHHTNHIADHPYIEVLSAHESRDHSRSCLWPSYKSSRQDSHRSYSHSSRSWGKPHLKKNPRLKIEDPHMSYYSSDEHSR